MEVCLSPTEEHYLKKELLRREIAREFDALSPEFNDISGLRRFGPPFIPMDPKLFHKSGINWEEVHTIGESMLDVVRAQFPILRYILENFIQTFPFIKIHLVKLGSSWMDQSPFWLKIQTLFEIWKTTKISNSNDRGSVSKRELLLSKVKSMILMLFNSGLRTTNEDAYFESNIDNKGAYKKLGKLMTHAEQERLNQLELDNSSNFEIEDIASSLSLNIDDIEDSAYTNGWYINIVGVTKETELKKGVLWGNRESHYYSFILRVKRDTDPEGWYIKRRYRDFSELSKEMKLLYPNVKKPHLPSKDKHNGLFSNANAEDIEEIEHAIIEDDNIEIAQLMEKSESSPPSFNTLKSVSSETFKMKSPKTPNLGHFKIGKLERSFKNSLKVPIKSHNRSMSDGSMDSFDTDTKLPRENLRLALRGYIKSLAERSALVKSPEFLSFLTNSPMLLSPDELTDVDNRIKMDHLVTLQHLKFQKALVKVISDLEKQVLEMKDELYLQGFNYIFDELRDKPNIEELSLPIKSVIEVVELEISSTIYELFIGSDGAAETYKIVKRMHKLMPYKMMATILRFTNPLQIVKKFIDLFTYQPFGKGRSLLQVIFMGALSDDVKKYDNELKGIVNEFNAQDLQCIYERIDEYFASNDEVVLEIKEISKKTGLELAIAILMPKNGLQVQEVEPKTLVNILTDCKNNVRRNDSVYTLAVRYFQRKLRKWDKEMMRELWETGELMDVIKELMSIFFEPLIELFKRAEVYKYVPIFQKFMNELIGLCDDYLYHNANQRGDIVVSLMSLEEKYSEYVYKFMREMYVNDLKMPAEKRLFEGIISWMNKFIEFLAIGKSSDRRHHFGLDEYFAQLKPEDQIRVKEYTDTVINRVAKKRELFKDIDEGAPVKKGGLVSSNWDKITNRVVAIGTLVSGDLNLAIDESDDDDEDTDETGLRSENPNFHHYDSIGVFMHDYLAYLATTHDVGVASSGEEHDVLQPLMRLRINDAFAQAIFS